jgi:hypothetical protein
MLVAETQGIFDGFAAGSVEPDDNMAKPTPIASAGPLGISGPVGATGHPAMQQRDNCPGAGLHVVGPAFANEEAARVKITEKELEVRVSEKGVGLGLPAGNPMGAASNSKILPLGDGWRGRPCFL